MVTSLAFFRPAAWPLTRAQEPPCDACSSLRPSKRWVHQDQDLESRGQAQW